VGGQIEVLMLLVVCGVVVLLAVGLIPRLLMSGRDNASALGWMSEQWLAEHRVLPPR
jgi:hypothetical protein